MYGGHGDRAEPGRPVLTGIPFNDAYRYMDWLLTVPLLLIEIILVMSLSPEESNRQCWRLGTLSALMILSGYKGELVLTGDLTPRCPSSCSLSRLFWSVWPMPRTPRPTPR